MVTPLLMSVSVIGLRALAGFEGTILNLYYDVAGIQTVCTGHVVQKGEDWSTVTAEKCQATLARDVSRFERCVNETFEASVRSGNLLVAQPMFDACVCLAFNIGTEGFRTSSVARLMNARLLTQAAGAFLLWQFAKVKKKDGSFVKEPVLRGRREAEVRLFRSGIAQALFGGNWSAYPEVAELVATANANLFDLRMGLLDDRGLPRVDDNAYADDGRLIVMPPEVEEAA
jgi:lysozyme